MTRNPSIEQRYGHQPRAANIKDYLRLARFDHSTKHMFILPGIALALLLRGDQAEPLLNIPLGFLAAICAASANYVINEWLDRDFDRHHPEKSERAAVQVSLDIRLVYAWYGTLALAAVALGFAIHGGFGVTILCFLAAGLVYNVPPLRSKDRPYLDVVSESVNNPLRLMLGWAMIDPVTLPPVSVLLSFWFGGAFLMNTKRLAEFRDIVADLGQARLALYRKSSDLCFFMRDVPCSLRGEIPHRICAAVPDCRVSVRVQTGSVARKPEKLFSEIRLMAASGAATLVFVLTTIFDIPVLDMLAEQHFIDLHGFATIPDPSHAP